MTVTNSESPATEPWMRGTHTEFDSLRRGVVHALQLAKEDADRWAAGLNESQMDSRPASLPSVGFHLRHIARSLDRLLTYAEDRQLSEQQLSALATEHQETPPAATLQEFRDGIDRSISRIAVFAPKQYEEPRGIGRRRLPTTVGGLILHCAEHTQRHTGQMVLTAKLVAQAHGFVTF